MKLASKSRALPPLTGRITASNEMQGDGKYRIKYRKARNVVSDFFNSFLHTAVKFDHILHKLLHSLYLGIRVVIIHLTQR